MYVITSGEIKREYDTSEPHIALQKFFNETASDLDSTTIRSYGGATYPARVLWPRKESRTKVIEVLVTEREEMIYTYISNYVDEIVENHYAKYKSSVELSDSGDCEVDRNAAWARGALTMAAEIQYMLAK